ncbi:PAM68 family protein [Synechococcus sp. CS-1324]|uniref:PAM68 family protein n=1 Tax=unclassified Synechococcus TaxID=2626047 RepID=UPI000DB88585|nr:MULTISPECIES: PAM68 family protein [unclassified Synechococcus]MCT0213950.1 PAM68 family protein [Synechococcus sp. CS-1326]MCT0230852.1 PAM68 family protein [Synechococcus sp. CS-1324]MCT0233526.1 PAM68 family protein [Synechococcus sp. CS-1327]PZV03375.1 MAG: DUF3464 domain-containing protein [Cyanobium sp.]
MAAKRKPLPFKPDRAAAARAAGGGKPQPKAKPATSKAARTSGSQVIPSAVANRMARRIAIATGVPSFLGMAVFVASYLLVSRDILAIPTVATLAASGGCFLLGLLGLSYGVLSASWEEAAGSWFGAEQIGLNLRRVGASLKAMRQGGKA